MTLMSLNISEYSGIFQSRGFRRGAVIVGAVLIALLFFSTLLPEAETETLPADNADAAEERLERRLEQLLSEIDGVISPAVMITLDSTTQRVYARDESAGESSVVLAGGGRTPVEESTRLPEVRGAAVVCGGAQDPLIKEKVVNTVAGVLDISSSRIYVTY